MKKKADTDDGWFKVANDLMQAIAQARITGAQHAVCAWLLCSTYGRKTRFGKGKDQVEIHRNVEINHSQIARETGLHRALARRAVSSLIACGVLKINEKNRIGFNTQIDKWPLRRSSEIQMGILKIGLKTRAYAPMGTDAHGRPSVESDAPVRQDTFKLVPPPDARARQKTSVGGSNARARVYGDVGENGEVERAAGAATAPPPFQENGLTDTPRARIRLGDERYPPDEHPRWDREIIGYQSKEIAMREWREECAANRSVRLNRESRQRMAKLRAEQKAYAVACAEESKRG